MYAYVEYLRNTNLVRRDNFLEEELSRIISISTETQKVEFLMNILDIIYLKLTARGDTIIQLKRVCDYVDESFLVAHSSLKEKILKIVNEIYKPDVAKKRLIINSQELFNEEVKETIMNKIPSILEEQIDKMELFLANIKIDKFSDAKYLIPKIKTKEIMKFYEKYEPTEDQIALWNNYWRQQNPYDRNPPPEPAGWWLRDQMLNIHSTSSVSSTDCKLKLLKQLEFEPYQIEDVAEDIYETTLRIAEEDASEEKMSLSKKESYIKRNVIDISLILNCRRDENTPKYYGYGDVYDEARASLLNDDQRVELCDILAKIWLFIKQKVEDKDVQRQLIIQFMIAFRDHLSGGVCTQGWVSALTNIFGVYTKEFGFSCLTKDQEQSEDLTNKLLIDSGILDYEGESDKVTIEKIFNQRSGVLAEADIESDDWDEKEATIMRDDVLVKLTKEENVQFRKNLERYKILYDPQFEKNEQKRIETMKEFLNEMFPEYFMLAVVDYLKTPTNTSDRYTLRIIKDAVSESFAAYQIRKLKLISESSRDRREKEIFKEIPKSTFRIYKRDSKYKKNVKK